MKGGGACVTKAAGAEKGDDAAGGVMGAPPISPHAVWAFIWLSGRPLALGVRKGLQAAVELLLLVVAAVEEDKSEAGAMPPDMAKGLLSWAAAAAAAAFSAFLAPATKASKLTNAELAPRKSSGDLLGLLLPCNGDPHALPPDNAV